MSNSYYNHTTYPTPNSPGSSATLRLELESITTGFSLLPTLASNGYKVAMVNSAGTALTASAALQSLAITSSSIDSTPVGATTASTGRFAGLIVSSGAATLGSSVTIAGGVMNNTIIGGTTPAAGAFTTLSASSGFTGALVGNVTGNLTGNVTGNVAGNLTGNVVSSGTSTFAAITMSGAIAMGTSKITGLGEPTLAQDAATKNYTDTGLALKLSLTGGTMSGAIAMGTSKITGVGDPTAAQDVATKSYVDTVSQGLDAKASCRVATTANITLSGAQTIDGIAVVAGDRVLVKDQTTTANNGIYLCAASTWTRTTDADAWTELPAAFVFVEVGTLNANNGYVCTVAAGGTLGTTAITWTQFSGAGQITAGLGLTKTGNTIDVGTASSSRIVVNANDIDLATTGVSAATYQSMTVDTYGRVTAGTNPTTLAGYNISNAYTTTQVDTALALKLNLSGGTMSGAIAMGTSKITGMGDPTTNQDAATKIYVDGILGSATAAATSATAAATSATNAASSASSASGSSVSAGTSATNAAASETSALASSTSAGTSATNAGTSATNAAASAASASTSAGTATTQASNASTSATTASTQATSATSSASTATTQASNASTSATAAAASATAAGNAQTAAEAARDATLSAYDNFDDRYLGSKTSDPTVDNDGNPLVAGSLYFNSGSGAMKVYTGAAWVAAYVSGSGYLASANNLSDVVSTSSARTNLGLVTVASSGSATDLDSGTLPTGRLSGSYTGVTGVGTLTTGSIPTTLITGALPIANGGNGLTTAPTNGQIDIGNGIGFTRSSLTAGTGVSVTNGGGSITLANTGVTSAVAGTGVSVSGATGAVTLSIGQAVATSSNVQFNSLGVGTAGSATAGEIRATNNITAYYTSDIKFKENIKPIKNASEIVRLIGADYFDWTDDYITEHGGEDGYFIQKSDFGVIAQKVQKVFPKAVRIKPDGTLAVDYEKLGVLAFPAIAEMLERLDRIESRQG